MAFSQLIMASDPFFSRLQSRNYSSQLQQPVTIPNFRIPHAPPPLRPSGAGIGIGIGRKISSSSSSSITCFSALTPELKTTLDKVVTSHKVVLFMKGTKDFPQCGFSNTVVQILTSLNVPFQTIDVLENQILRLGLKEYSNWPTFPQLYIDGQFFGGCDITLDAYKCGELQEVLEKAMCS